MLYFLSGPLAIWPPIIFPPLVLLILIFYHFFANRHVPTFLKLKFFTAQRLVWIFLIVGVIYDSFLTGLQYYVWKMSPFGQFLMPPNQPINYFLRYSFFHFWLADLIIIICAVILFFILKAFRRVRAEALSLGDIYLSALACLIVGWPNLVILLPVFFVLMIIGQIGSLIFFKRSKLSPVWPLILATAITIVIGTSLLYWLGFSLLAIG